jgi:hypothetical protein
MILAGSHFQPASITCGSGGLERCPACAVNSKHVRHSCKRLIGLGLQESRKVGEGQTRGLEIYRNREDLDGCLVGKRIRIKKIRKNRENGGQRGT